MKQVVVVAAIIQSSEQVLCVQRGLSKLDYISQKWEFPGGKIEDGETEPLALQREIREELKIDVVVADKFLTVDHTYPDFNLIMETFLCTPESDGFPELTLTEHLSYKWLAVQSEEFVGLDWAAADIPIVNALRSSE
jgi:8-oxo-dGTP diphosphatase